MKITEKWLKLLRTLLNKTYTYYLSFCLCLSVYGLQNTDSSLPVLLLRNSISFYSQMNSHTTSSGAFEGDIHTRDVDPYSQPPAGNAPSNLSVANGAVGGLLFPQQMVSRIRSSLFQVHWVSKWGWGPLLLIWLCRSTATQPRRLKQWICTLIHSMW